MSGNSALLDSNIIIYLSKRELPLSFLDQFDECHISIITYMEVLGYQFRDTTEESFIRGILGAFHLLYIDEKIADTVIQIRRRTSIKLPAAIIAATAMAADLQLVTRNGEDFRNAITQIVNPFD